MDCSKRSVGAVAGLPDDPLVDILSRVPAKSVCRFKCVSKGWCDLIADPHHRKKLAQPMQGLFYTMPRISEDEGSKVDNLHFGFIDLMARPVPLDIDPALSFLTEQPGIQMLHLLDSCNGLILFKHCRHQNYSDELGYIVCNPTSKQWQAVPTCGGPHQITVTQTHLAFDPAASSHFHLVQFGVDDRVPAFVSVHAYSSEIGTWSHNQIDKHEEPGQLQGWHHQVTPSFELFHCAFLNGILHLMAWDWDQDQQLIVAVDVQGKTRRIITLPDMANASHCCVCYFGQSQGCLHCITHETLDVHEKSYKLSIWVLQDYDTREWVLKDTLNSLDLFGCKSCRHNMSEFEVVDIHRDCNLLFLIQGNKLLAYNMGCKDGSVIATFENQSLPCWWDFARYVPCFSETPALTNKH